MVRILGRCQLVELSHLGLVLGHARQVGHATRERAIAHHTHHHVHGIHLAWRRRRAQLQDILRLRLLGLRLLFLYFSFFILTRVVASVCLLCQGLGRAERGAQKSPVQ